MPDEIVNNTEEGREEPRLEELTPIQWTDTGFAFFDEETDLRNSAEDLEELSSFIRGGTTNIEVPTPRINSTSERVLYSFNKGFYKDTSKEESEEGKVKLFETGEIVDKEDTIYSEHIGGYFLKNDVRVFKDSLAKNERYIVIDRKYKSCYSNGYHAIINDINDDGSINFNTIIFTITYFETEFKLAKLLPVNDSYLILDRDNNVICDELFISKTLLDSSKFHSFYKESMKHGYFILNSYMDKTELEKNKKWMYRKRKLLLGQSFKSYMENKPKIYNAMFGKKYTFGVEIETSSGYIPERFDSELFYSAVHDGSLRDEEGNTYGGEYVTDVLYGDLGLLQLRKLTNELSKRCMINHKCGLHVHLGNVNFNKENVVLMYNLYQRLEREIFGMLPKSRTNNEYCRKLKALTFDINHLKGNQREYYIDYYYNNIMHYLSQKDFCNKNINKKHDHPKGFKCNYDHSSARYCWVNFIPAVFNTRKNNIYTIEFRPHSATTSYKKIKNWLFICIALVDIVENHKSELYNNFEMNLHEIIKIVYPKTYLKISDYIHKRTSKFNNIEMRPEDVEATDYVDNEIENNLSIKNL